MGLRCPSFSNVRLYDLRFGDRADPFMTTQFDGDPRAKAA
jgi:hypothetical protein